MEVKDASGKILSDGDTVTLSKDLKLKGTNTVIKRGTKVKNIRLTDNPDEIDCRVNKMSIVLRTEFVKKA
ncbi:MAG: alkylphosphonate utilization protein [Flavobacteriales bacterium]|jgi:protein PhnA|tara:strand:+ start:856 stop:1065 length:210 start_codon:yes stop_codon:yes gene_type:complete